MPLVYNSYIVNNVLNQLRFTQSQINGEERLSDPVTLPQISLGDKCVVVCFVAKARDGNRRSAVNSTNILAKATKILYSQGEGFSQKLNPPLKLCSMRSKA
jgi:hypothetical protein